MPVLEPLDRVLKQVCRKPLELTRLLRIAAGLAAAIGEVHRQGLTHKDIKPANILVNVAGDVRLTGFGMASRLPREPQASMPLDTFSGTLAYMAPEQTGRMNRSIDTRSDLYSLGVTLYEMFTGRLPFAAEDALGWVHSHIAIQPKPPSEVEDQVPGSLSNLIMKLLTKTPEDRYQTASGLEADIRRCLAEWEEHAHIRPFALGTSDASDRLLIPEKLYGREAEVAALTSTFHRVLTKGTTEVILLRGYSGIGKSSVVNELHKILVPAHGLFAFGKFDQYMRDIPYATLAQAFQALARQILAKSAAELAEWRSSLEEALGTNGQLMVNLIPQLEFIIGKQPAVSDLPPNDAQNRFQVVFRRFLSVFARPDHPLVLFLDDLQWLDTATLDLLNHLITAPGVRNLLLIGAYRDTEVGPSHPLSATLTAMRKAEAGFQEIRLAPLALRDLTQLIADAVRNGRQHFEPLAQLVYEKTGGNPFFANQFLSALADDGLLTFDPSSATWTWDLAKIRTKSYTDNIGDLMATKLNRQPDATKAALRKLACLGAVAEISTLSLVRDASEEELDAALWDAARAGLISRADDKFAFLHDRIQQAAYELIPPDERGPMHLRIGRALASRAEPKEIEKRIFDIVSQFNRGATSITSREELDQVAEFNLIAGKRAQASMAYGAALAYFAVGESMLSEDIQEARHDLAFALQLHRAQCEYLTGELATAEERLSILSRRAKSIIDSAAVTRLRSSLYATLNRNDLGIGACLDFLQQVGVDWSIHPTDEEVQREFNEVWRVLGRRSIEELIALPHMSDQDSRATLDVLTSIAPPGVVKDPNLHHLIVFRMVNLSLSHGNSDGSCVAYVLFGMILGSEYGDYGSGFRFGQLGIELLEKSGLNRFESRVYMDFVTVVNPWRMHISTGLGLLRRAFNKAQEGGDLTFAAYSCNNLVTHLLAAGSPLDELQASAETGMEFARKARFGLVIDVITGQLRFIRALRGLTKETSSFSDADFDELRFEQHLEEDPYLAVATCSYWIRKLQAGVYGNDHSSAVAAASKAERLIWVSPSRFGRIALSSRMSHGLELAEYHFFAALARAGHYHSAAANEQASLLEILAVHYGKLKDWAGNCPENFENRAALVGAEIARLESRELDAEQLYEVAIRSAQKHGFVHNEAIAYEIAARFYAARGFDTFANAYRWNARSCYLRWGAVGKVRQLDQQYPHLLDNAVAVPQSAPNDTSIAQLDVATVAKASQAVFGEIVLGKLIETLMAIAIENAGAERGLLVLIKCEEPQIAAEATTGLGIVEVRLRDDIPISADLPISVLNYVIRTREKVVLGDPVTGTLFADDPYMKQSRLRSLLCFPIIKQTKLIGLLYLENTLITQAFTSEGIKVLELLAAQAAISLENASLYADLERENSDRKRAEEGLRRSEAYLATAQKLSNTGSWGWNVATGEVYWSDEIFRILDLDPRSMEPSQSALLSRIHPSDRNAFEAAFNLAVSERREFTYEYRIVVPDGSIKYLQTVSYSIANERGDLEIVGTVIDNTQRKRSEDALHNAQKDLARVSRLTTMGEFVASIAHEINQPLTAIVANGSACLQWLANEIPNIHEARKAVEQILENGKRAGDVTRSIRALAMKSLPEISQFEIDQAIEEVLALTRTELHRHDVTLMTELSASRVVADRVQMQQVVLNLVSNAIEAMSASDRLARVLKVTCQIDEPDVIHVSVSDTGTGLDPEKRHRIFDAFFTTKSNGMGLGLSICRSILESHGGRLWTEPNSPRGSIFHFTVPSRKS
jgi:predicted ATPase/signal transduction histidine kinase